MSQRGLLRILVALAGLMGAAGVALAAASSMLLFHATAVLAAVLLLERLIVHPGIGLAAGFAFVAASALFAGDLTLRQYAGHGLFPMAAPTGGTLLIVSWLILAAAALWPRRA